MTQFSCGLLSELLLVRIHGRAEAYLRAQGAERDALVAACRREATVPDLAHRILSRTVYAQSSSRVGPIRELLQNALDASPRGARIDVRLSDDGRELSVTDRGRGMTRAELLDDLLVPFRSGKEADPEAIGEHGIGFFTALEIAPRIEVVTVTASDGHRLHIAPLGLGPRHDDFAWTLLPLPGASCGATGRLAAPSASLLPEEVERQRAFAPRRAMTGTSVRLSLAHRIARQALLAEVAAAVGLVDPAVARIYVDGVQVNTARARLRRVAEVPIQLDAGGSLELYVGRAEGIDPQLTIIQKGLTVATRIDPFPSLELGLHRDLARAITAAGFGMVAELPLAVPLNKGRSGVAASASAAFEAALAAAFERFILRDALYDRELLRAVDHRLSSVLDRLLAAALLGETLTLVPAKTTEELDPASRAPTVAAPEDVIRFASGLLDAPVFRSVTFDALHCPDPRPRSSDPRDPGPRLSDPRDPGPRLSDPRDPGPRLSHPRPGPFVWGAGAPAGGLSPDARQGRIPHRTDARSGARTRPTTLRELLQAHRTGVLRGMELGPGQRASRWVPAVGPSAAGSGVPSSPGLVYLALDDPLAHALWRRLSAESAGTAAAAPGPGCNRARASVPSASPMPRTPRDLLVRTAGEVPGVCAVAAAMTVVERIDAAISAAAGLSPSPIWVHQDLYGPDEMAHTDGSGISVNLASPRIRVLLTVLLLRDDPVAFSALVDLVLHEKTHVSLATYVPRPTAEHGTSFYRRKDWLRRRLLAAIAGGAVPDPMAWLPAARHGLTSAALPPPELLARAFQLAVAAA